MEPMGGFLCGLVMLIALVVLGVSADDNEHGVAVFMGMIVLAIFGIREWLWQHVEPTIVEVAAKAPIVDDDTMRAELASARAELMKARHEMVSMKANLKASVDRCEKSVADLSASIAEACP